MQVKGIVSNKTWVKLGLAGTLLAAFFLPGQNASAVVQGRCDTCHTMHNSANSNSVVSVGSTATNFAGWVNAGTGVAASNLTSTGAVDNTAQETLLVSDCVGCHSNTETSTIVLDPNGNKIPIVFNTGGYPAGTPGQADYILAGGNFAGVVANESNGHNVRGIVVQDSILNTMAPGAPPGACAPSCHTDLTETDANTDYGGQPDYKFNGCKGCHVKTSHHVDNGAYRFLGGHDPFLGIDIVDGIGDPTGNWEQDPAAGHNIYKRQSTPDMSGDRALAPIGMFCAGCHLDFHASGAVHPFWGIDNQGDDNTDNLISSLSASSPWLRHPTNVNIPNNGEYAVLFTGTVAYDTITPVAQDLVVGDPDNIDSGDQVMCLSCHRAHASDQLDALRFDYTGMQAHSALVADQDTGCFYCHRSKDT